MVATAAQAVAASGKPRNRYHPAMKKTPKPSVATMNPTLAQRRFVDVPAKAVPLLRDVERALDAGDVASAERGLALALLHAPQHPYTLLLLGRSQFRRGQWLDAVQTLLEAETGAPDSVDILIELGRAQSAASHLEAALASLRRACERKPEPSVLLELGVILDGNARADEALDIADRILAMDSSHVRARLLRARSLQVLGRIADTAAEYRELIRRRQEVPAAWFALMDIKTIRLGDDEFSALKNDHRDLRWNDVERSYLGYALGRACEDAADYPGAVMAFDAANALVRRRTHWNAPAWSREVDGLLTALDQSPVQGSLNADQGSEVIFIVGLPRSGTTLVEQILGAHSQVEGANELPDLAAVIDAETARRRRPFIEWIVSASDQDWHRLGHDYLQRTARWREAKPMHTDKMPENWVYAGAIRRMLPGARIIDSRRDPVETAWSCYKQLFAPHRVAYSYDAMELAAYWRDYDRFMRELMRRHPSSVRLQSYEELVSDLEQQVSGLLDFCGLRWEIDCLQPHRSVRAVRTASSAQVREPVRKGVARVVSYGESLNPFRRTILGVQAGSPAS